MTCGPPAHAFHPRSPWTRPAASSNGNHRAGVCEPNGVTTRLELGCAGGAFRRARPPTASSAAGCWIGSRRVDHKDDAAACSALRGQSGRRSGVPGRDGRRHRVACDSSGSGSVEPDAVGDGRAYLLALASLMAAAGRVADVNGRRRTFLVGAVIFAVGLRGLRARPDCRGADRRTRCAGVGAALLVPLGYANATLVVPEERRGWALGIVSTGATVFLAVGPVLGCSPRRSSGARLRGQPAADPRRSGGRRSMDARVTRRATRGHRRGRLGPCWYVGWPR